MIAPHVQTWEANATAGFSAAGTLHQNGFSVASGRKMLSACRPAAGNSVILSPAEVKRVATGIQLELAWLFMVLLQLRSRGSFAQVLEGEHRDFAQPWCSSPSSRPLIP